MINFENLQKSIEFYENKGFPRIEAPWTVSKYVDEITKPKDVLSFQLHHNGKCLVASGEQSFLYLYLKGFLPKGQFQAITPCYRFESFDHLHTKYFMKNELIKTDKVDEEALNEILMMCHEFYQQFFTDPIDIVKTEIGFDLEIGGDELGSYGIRSCDFLDWIYATGCAEPRLSSLMKKHNKTETLKRTRI
jgi:hypothetical protein